MELDTKTHTGVQQSEKIDNTFTMPGTLYFKEQNNLNNGREYQKK